jgi:hypothetical protein
MAIPPALRFKRSLLLVGLLGTIVAVLMPVRAPAGIRRIGHCGAGDDSPAQKMLCNK